MAYLTDKTDSVENTFTTSDISITLEESEDLDLKMIPGHTITKDPTVKVAGDSEDAWLFVKLEKSENFDDFMTYGMADGWTELTGFDGVYYRKVLSTDAVKSFSALKDDQVTVKDTVTKVGMNALDEATYPTLTVTAYAHQYSKDGTNSFTAAEAWVNLNP